MFRAVEVGFIGFLLKLNKKNAREAGRKAGKELDKFADARYGAQKSEAVQANVCGIVKLFSDTLIATLQEDWTPQMRGRYQNLITDMPDIPKVKKERKKREAKKAKKK